MPTNHKTKPPVASYTKPTRAREADEFLAKLRVRRPSVHGGYGWVRDLPDERDFIYAAPLLRFPRGLPHSVDLRPECPPIYDQGQLGSCTANGIAAAIEFDQLKQAAEVFVPSRLFIYYNERAIEGTISQDSGAQIRDGIKSVTTLGAPPEKDWPYDIQKFSDKPSTKAFHDAKTDLVAMYARVTQNLVQMQGCLASGFPFVFGFTVYESFESQEVADTGEVPIPPRAKRSSADTVSSPLATTTPTVASRFGTPGAPSGE